MDLFSGAGFGAAGAHAAGGNPVLSVDSWELAVSTYSSNFPQADARCGDLTKKSPKTFGARLGLADVLLASPECTSHSVARGGKPADERSRETALVVPKWVKALKPRWVVLENVLQIANWARHDELISRLEDLGYAFETHRLNAVDYGAPQSRRRLFVVGRRGATPPNLDLAPYRAQGKSVEDIVQWDQWPTTPLRKKGRAKSTLARADRAIKALGKGVPFLLVYYGSDGSGGWQRIDSPLRTVTTLDRFAVVTWRGRTPHMRMLQPPELAAAMGAPHHQLDQGTRREKVKLCGNGICSPVTEAIFRAIRAIENS